METSWWTLSGLECCFEWVGERRPRGPHHTHTCAHPWGRAEPLSPPQPHRHRWPFNYVGKKASGPHAWSWHCLLTKFVLKPDQAMRRPPCVNLVSLRRPDWKPLRLPGHEAVLPPLQAPGQMLRSPVTIPIVVLSRRWPRQVTYVSRPGAAGW